MLKGAVGKIPAARPTGLELFYFSKVRVRALATLVAAVTITFMAGERTAIINDALQCWYSIFGSFDVSAVTGAYYDSCSKLDMWWDHHAKPIIQDCGLET